MLSLVFVRINDLAQTCRMKRLDVSGNVVNTDPYSPSLNAAISSSSFSSVAR